MVSFLEKEPGVGQKITLYIDPNLVEGVRFRLMLEHLYCPACKNTIIHYCGSEKIAGNKVKRNFECRYKKGHKGRKIFKFSKEQELRTRYWPHYYCPNYDWVNAPNKDKFELPPSPPPDYSSFMS